MDVAAGARARARAAARRGDALLHGRGLALAQAEGAGGRSPPMVREVRALGLETCATLGMLDAARRRTSSRTRASTPTTTTSTPRQSSTAQIITTRSYQERLDTLAAVRAAGINVCCGGIVGMGESAQRPRASCCARSPTCPQHPESVPINRLVRVAGTPLADAPAVDPFDFVRMIAVARVLMPRAHVRLVGGPRER